MQEPKLRLAYDLAKALGVTLDYLVEDSPEVGPDRHLVTVTEEELMILKIARRLGSDVAMDRLLALPTVQVTEPRGSTTAGNAARARPEPTRYDGSREDA